MNGLLHLFTAGARAAISVGKKTRWCNRHEKSSRFTPFRAKCGECVFAVPFSKESVCMSERCVPMLTSRLYLMKQAGNMDEAPGFKLEKFAKMLLSPTPAGGSQGCLMFIQDSFWRCSAVHLFIYFQGPRLLLLDSWTFLELQTKCRLDAKLSFTTFHCAGPGPDFRARLLSQQTRCWGCCWSSRLNDSYVHYWHWPPSIGLHHWGGAVNLHMDRVRSCYRGIKPKTQTMTSHVWIADFSSSHRQCRMH